MSTAIADILTKAADLIEPEGEWAQGHDICFGGSPICAGIAIGRCADDFSPARRFFHEHIGEEVSTWNDAPGRTQAEVVAALRAAAEKARTTP